MKRIYLICLLQFFATTFLLSKSNPVALSNQNARVVSSIDASQADAQAQARVLGKPAPFVRQGDSARLQARPDRVALGRTTLPDTLGGRSQTAKAVSASANSRGASFLPPVDYIAGCTATSVVAGDVNGDGFPDLVVADWYQDCTDVFGPGAVRVMLGNGDGTFKTAVSYGSGGYQAFDVAIGDVNRDGKMDLVVVSDCEGDGNGGCVNGPTGQVGVLLGNGDGTFQPAVSYTSGASITVSVAITDVNGDSYPDLVLGNSCQPLGGEGCTSPGSVGVLLGNGDGTFRLGGNYLAGGDYGASFAVADVNGDGHPDVVVVGGQDTGFVSVLLGNADGSFQPAVSYTGLGSQSDSVATADFNGDGHPDIVVASFCPSAGLCDNGILAVLLGNGDGTFQAPVIYGSGGYGASSVAVADVNADGHPDLIVATSDPNGPGSSGPGQLGVLLGNGDGTFQAAESFPAGGGGSRWVAAADVNHDGNPDLLVANFCGTGICDGRTQGSVGVLLSEVGVPQAATTTGLACSPSSSAYGQTVSCTATVHGGSRAPNGAVILYEGSIPVGSSNLAKRKAVIPVGSLTVGTDAVMAVYQGAVNFAPSTSPSLNQVVVIAPTTVSVAPSINPAPIGQPVTFTATVIGQYGGGTATGTMTFQTGTKVLATVNVSGSQATFSKAFKNGGIYSITATYSGDSNNKGSTSPGLNEVVNHLPYASQTTLATSGSPSLLGQPVTFTATVSFAGNAVPNGERVTFYDSLTEIGTGTTAGGMATFTTASLKAKTHTIKATYQGDGSLKASSGRVQQIVTQ
jgi:hypothetical protein